MVFGIRSKPDQVYKALQAGLERMRVEYVDRAVLSINETAPDPSTATFSGRWISDTEQPKPKTSYYPFEVLTEAEQDMIMKGRTYDVVSLVLPRVMGSVTYHEPGIEEITRTRMHWFLPKLKPTAKMNYHRTDRFYDIHQMKVFTEDAASSGWTPESIDKAVDAGISEYHAITKRLMAPVRSAIAAMNEVGYMPTTDVYLDEIRQKIESARKNKTQ